MKGLMEEISLKVCSLPALSSHHPFFLLIPGLSIWLVGWGWGWGWGGGRKAVVVGMGTRSRNGTRVSGLVMSKA